MSCADLGRFSALYSSVIYASLFKRDAAAFRLYVLLVHEAAYHDKTVRRWNGHDFELGQGEVVASQAWLSENSGCSRKVIRRALEDLEAQNYIRANRGPTNSQKWANKGANKGTVFLVCDYSDLYASKEKKGQQKGQQTLKKGSKKGQQTGNHSSLCINTNTPSNSAREERESVASQDSRPAGQAAEPSLAPPASDEKASITPDCLVAAWKQAASRFGLADISEVPPARLRAIEAAIRAKNDLSFWQAAFEAAGKEKAWSNGKRPDFDYCLTYMKALRLIEGASKPKPVHHQREITAKDLTR